MQNQNSHDSSNINKATINIFSLLIGNESLSFNNFEKLNLPKILENLKLSPSESSEKKWNNLKKYIFDILERKNLVNEFLQEFRICKNKVIFNYTNKIEILKVLGFLSFLSFLEFDFKWNFVIKKIFFKKKKYLEEDLILLEKYYNEKTLNCFKRKLSKGAINKELKKDKEFNKKIKEIEIFRRKIKKLQTMNLNLKGLISSDKNRKKKDEEKKTSELFEKLLDEKDMKLKVLENNIKKKDKKIKYLNNILEEKNCIIKNIEKITLNFFSSNEILSTSLNFENISKDEKKNILKIKKEEKFLDKKNKENVELTDDDYDWAAEEENYSKDSFKSEDNSDLDLKKENEMKTILFNHYKNLCLKLVSLIQSFYENSKKNFLDKKN